MIELNDPAAADVLLQLASRAMARLGIEDFPAQRIERFLTHLEKERDNSISTHNARLTAIHTIARRSGIWQPRFRQPEMRLGRAFSYQGALPIFYHWRSRW
jgi:hypothetical protein